MIFQTFRNYSLKYQRSTTSSCKDKGIKKIWVCDKDLIPWFGKSKVNNNFGVSCGSDESTNQSSNELPNQSTNQSTHNNF